mgnify:FL=1|jgi:hypothetical protein
MNYHENYSNVGSACNYASLASYNNADGLNLPQPKNSDQGTYITPSFGGGSGGGGYNSLTHGNASCSGFPTISHAYGNPNKPTQYLRYPCGGTK